MNLPVSPRRWTPASVHAWEVAGLRLFADATAVVLGFWFSYRIYVGAVGLDFIDRPAPPAMPYVTIAIVFALVTLLVFAQEGLYRGRSTVLNLWELEAAVRGILLSAALLFALLFFLKLEEYSRYVILNAIALSGLLVLLERRLLAALVRKLKLRGFIGRRTLIYGCDRTGQLLMKKILESPHGAILVGYLDDYVPIGSTVCCRVKQTDPRLFEAPVLGRLEDLEEVTGRWGVEELLVAGTALGSERQREIVDRANAIGLAVGLVPSLGDVRSDLLRLEEMSAIPVLRPISRGRRTSGRATKRAFDLAAGAALLVVTMPAWAVAALLIRLEGSGPILFQQQRVGRGGRPFRLYKFRTMVGSAPPYASSPPGDVDPNITRVGRFLRRTGLDELPQLVNVLKGEMSLVGPRPEMPHLVQKYGPLERRRLEVKPGITGLWQLSADRHAEIHENVEYDLYYVNHQSFLLDVLILLETAFFTAGVVAGSFERRMPGAGRDDRKGPVPAPPGDEYVLVALDQRWTSDAPPSWRMCLPALYAISDRWAVRFVVTDANRRALDILLDDARAGVSSNGHRFAYAPYASRSELKRLTESARLVVTDLPHVMAWSNEAGVDLLTVERGGVRWTPKRRIPDPIVSELSHGLTVFVGPQEEEAASGRGAQIIRMTRG